MAYERLDGPLGPVRGDYRAAMIATVIANVNRGKNSSPLSVQDFLPTWGAGKQQQSPEDMLRVIKQINRAAGGTEGGEDGDSRGTRDRRRRRNRRR